MPPAAASVRVGSKIPKMIGTTQMGTIKLHDYIDGAWTLLLTFPQDFHPVWATELGMLTKLKPQFDARNCRVLGLSVGSLKQQARFLDDVNETQDVQVNFPIFADESGDLSRTLGLISPSAPVHGSEHFKLPYSAAFLLDIDMIVQFVFYYPVAVGRNLLFECWMDCSSQHTTKWCCQPTGRSTTTCSLSQTSRPTRPRRYFPMVFTNSSRISE
ncbi:hypothetical protein, variant 1 [Aphanomyces astaci]|uniref:Thioredoxin domain-containing protein n=1 Tax=Aphanomyces astaci TaxID=112090 RepID=W4G0R6_APHAT|nr:hypothetical protein, variant 1 [Aphanomyces astaci]ETV72528.1 hypothetical protein, variant 1 [Aphanomyces astaci]|eukprot:XP_009838210.1 hypothetical protein, variant 1 [Aphanomyces astaci]